MITHICLIFLTLKRFGRQFDPPPVVFPKICFLGRELQIGPIEKGTHTNERTKKRCFEIFGSRHSSDELKSICWSLENHLLVYKLFEFASERVPAIKNKNANVFSPKNHLHYYNY